MFSADKDTTKPSVCQVFLILRLSLIENELQYAV